MLMSGEQWSLLANECVSRTCMPGCGATCWVHSSALGVGVGTAGGQPQGHGAALFCSPMCRIQFPACCVLLCMCTVLVRPPRFDGVDALAFCMPVRQSHVQVAEQPDGYAWPLSGLGTGIVDEQHQGYGALSFGCTWGVGALAAGVVRTNQPVAFGCHG